MLAFLHTHTHTHTHGGGLCSVVAWLQRGLRGCMVAWLQRGLRCCVVQRGAAWLSVCGTER